MITSVSELRDPDSEVGGGGDIRGVEMVIGASCSSDDPATAC